MARKRILVADDNRCLRTVIHHALSRTYDVCVVGDGAQLQTALETQPFDLVITDLNLPSRSGSTVLRRNNVIKVGAEQVEGLGVPAIVITGMDKEDNQVAIVKRMINVHDVIFKPLDLDYLCARVETVLKHPVPAVPPERELLKRCMRDMKKVLVVDDDPEVKDLISLSFEETGYQVRGCSSAEDALELCRQTNYSLLILDYLLEGDIANDVIRKLEEGLGSYAMPPILLVSGYGDMLTPAHLNDHPQLRGIICKPIVPSALLKQAKEIMTGSASTAECGV